MSDVDAPESAPPPEVAPAPDPTPAPVVAAPEQVPAPVEDPVMRAAIDRATTDALIAERERTAAAAVETKARIVAETEQRLRAEAEETARVAAMTQHEQLEHQISELKAVNASREADKAKADAELVAAGKKLDVAKAMSASGKRLATRGDGTPDKGLEELAYARIAEKTGAGMSETEAIAELAQTDPHLFARPAEPVQLASTGAGQSAPRGSVPPPRAPSADPEKDWMNAPKSEWATYEASQGWKKDISPTRVRN